jgi:hypothetical protein
MQDLATLVQIVLAAAVVAAPIIVLSLLLGNGEPVSLSLLYGFTEPTARGIQEDDVPRWRLEILDQGISRETSSAVPERRALRRRATAAYEPGR